MAGKKDDGMFRAVDIDGKTALFKADLEQREKLYEQYKNTEKAISRKSAAEIAKIESDAYAKALKIANTAQENAYKQMTARKRYEHDKAIAEEAKSTIASKDAEMKKMSAQRRAYNKEIKRLNAELAVAEQEGYSAVAEEIRETLEGLTSKIADLDKQTKTVKKEKEDIQKVVERHEQNKLAFETKHDQLVKKVAAQQNKVDEAKLKVAAIEFAHQEKIKKLKEQLRAAESSGDEKAIRDVQAHIAEEEKRFKASKEHKEAEKQLQKELNQLTRDQIEEDAQRKKEERDEASRGATRKAMGDSLRQAASNAMSNVMSGMTNGIDESLSAMYGAQGRMNARLQGLENNFTDSLDKVSTNIGMSGVVSQKAVVAKMTELIDSGVAYNIELRSFLATTAENIASTFNALDQTLLRIVRIQQADTTAARLGMEASLTRLFNETFKDTSYLSDVYDSVTSAIVDAQSQMTRDQSLEFEYALQKWMGALYSLGMSSESITNIAQGIGYLATGNTSALSGNDSLVTLLSMSASRGGKSYADLLTGNVTGSDVNTLLKQMIEYLAEIASSQENFVTKSAYADLFGMSITDLSTFASLYNNNSETFNKLFSVEQNYTSMLTEVGTQLGSISNRLNISQIIDTAIENALTSAATNIGGNSAVYGTWKALNIVESLTGGIALPFLNIFGSGVDLNTTVTQLAKTGIAGISLLGSLVESLSSGSLFGSYDMSQWGYDEYNQSGGVLTGITGGFTSGTSFSASMGVGSASGEDVQTTSMQNATDEAMESNGITSEELDEKQEIQSRMLDTLLSIEQLLDPKRVFYTGIAGVVGGNKISELTSAENNSYHNIASSAYITSTTLESTAANTDEKISNLIDTVSKDASEPVDLESIIAFAVKSALDNFITETQNTPLAVTPRNWV